MKRAISGKGSCAVALLLLLLTATVAPAYHHFVHYQGQTEPFTPVLEKFDVSALVGNRLQFFVSREGPLQMAPGDSFPALVSQIRRAGEAWNDISTSSLRVAFGGLFIPDATQSTPHVQILFDEMPPGVIAMGGPVSRDAVTTGPDAFVPITRSVVIFRSDMSRMLSSSDSFFLTAVHEMGHALGLQHTMTSGAMSTEPTRATTRVRPLSPDDKAGISLLYPAADYGLSVGSISGRVTLNGDGVHLASVVAVSPGGNAVSALTDPSGTYRIDGIPPGQYYVYAHPLPPARQPELGPADIVMPVDAAQNAFPAGPVFGAQFYPNTSNVLRAFPLSVVAEQNLEQIDFTVQARESLAFHGISTYSFPASVAVKPAFVGLNSKRPFLVAGGEGLTSAGAPTPGLRVTPLGGSLVIPAGGVKAYPPAPDFLQVDFLFNPFSMEGARHLVFSVENDFYVLPAGLNLVQKRPPSVDSLEPGFDSTGRRTVTLTGSGLFADTRILFDGAAAVVESVDALNGQMVVTPPPALSTHHAVVTALNRDGQSSLFVQGNAPPAYDYEPAAVPSITLSPAALPAGAEAMVEVRSIGTDFADTLTTLGFGSSDIVVRRVWTVSPTRLLANISVSPGASAGSADATVLSGLQLVSEESAFSVQPANLALAVLDPQLTNPLTGAQSIYAGGPAVLSVFNLHGSLAAPALSLDGIQASILSVSDNIITFQVPPGLTPGPVVLRLQAAGESIWPIVVAIDPQPPVIVSVRDASNSPLLEGQAAPPGALLNLLVSGLNTPGETVAAHRVRVTAGALEAAVVQVFPSSGNPDLHQVQFTLPPHLESGQQVSLTVAIDGRPSLPVLILTGEG